MSSEKSPKPPFCLGISVFNRSLLLRLALGCQLPVSFTPIFLGCISHRIRQATTDLHTINAKQSAQLGVSRAILVRILKVLVVSVVLALFLSLIGFFGGLGYNVNRIEEKSFVRTPDGFANATFICDLVYNPLLYPFYWLVGNGHPSGTFGMLVIPEGYPVIVDPFPSRGKRFRPGFLRCIFKRQIPRISHCNVVMGDFAQLSGSVLYHDGSRNIQSERYLLDSFGWHFGLLRNGVSWSRGGGPRCVCDIVTALEIRARFHQPISGLSV